MPVIEYTKYKVYLARIQLIIQLSSARKHRRVSHLIDCWSSWWNNCAYSNRDIFDYNYSVLF